MKKVKDYAQDYFTKVSTAVENKLLLHLNTLKVQPEIILFQVDRLFNQYFKVYKYPDEILDTSVFVYGEVKNIHPLPKAKCSDFLTTYRNKEVEVLEVASKMLREMWSYTLGALQLHYTEFFEREWRGDVLRKGPQCKFVATTAIFCQSAFACLWTLHGQALPEPRKRKAKTNPSWPQTIPRPILHSFKNEVSVLNVAGYGYVLCNFVMSLVAKGVLKVASQDPRLPHDLTSTAVTVEDFKLCFLKLVPSTLATVFSPCRFDIFKEGWIQGLENFNSSCQVEILSHVTFPKALHHNCFYSRVRGHTQVDLEDFQVALCDYFIFVVKSMSKKYYLSLVQVPLIFLACVCLLCVQECTVSDKG